LLDVAKMIGRDVSVGKISFNPFTQVKAFLHWAV
jgi:hypothetical protein